MDQSPRSEEVWFQINKKIWVSQIFYEQVLTDIHHFVIEAETLKLIKTKIPSKYLFNSIQTSVHVE